MSSSVTSVFACFALIAGLVPSAFAEWHATALAPAAKARPLESLSSSVSPAALIALPSLSPDQLRAAREKNARSTGAVQVAIVRDVAADASTNARALAWQRVGDGHVVRWRVRVDESQALRVALDVRKVAPGVIARFASNADLFAQPLSPGIVWSPLLPGHEAIVELFAPGASGTENVDVSIARIADHFANPALPDAMAKSQWLAAPCEVDLVCEAKSDPALERAGAASIKLNWIEGYSAYACSGTLMNPADGSFRPYVYTAAHCISTQAAADNLVTFWFYDKAECGGEEARATVQLAGGGVLLATDDVLDATLLKLNRMPPQGAAYAGWDTTAPTLGESLTALHHANGEVTKVSHGVVAPPPAYPRFAVAWTSGIVQGGSSGSGAFGRSRGPQGDLLVRGNLSSANASCTAPGYGYYSGLDKIWPKIAPWLSIDADYANATGLWWNAGEPGWGVSVSQQGDVAFAVLFTYSADGRASWLVASELRRDAAGALSGTLYRTDGKSATQAGTLKLALSDANAARLEYSIDGRGASKSITRQVFNGAAPICVGTTSSRANATNYQDLWFSPSDPGWGIGLAQQGDAMFATLFTHDAQGRGTWLVASDVARDAAGAFAGALYRTSLGTDGDKSLKVAGAGSVRIVFSDGEHGTATLVVDGRETTKAITRQVFGPTPPLCR